MAGPIPPTPTPTPFSCRGTLEPSPDPTVVPHATAKLTSTVNVSDGQRSGAAPPLPPSLSVCLAVGGGQDG